MSSRKNNVRLFSVFLVVAFAFTSLFNFSEIFMENANAQTAVLESLSLSGVTLSPAFNPAVTEYTATAGYNVNSTTIAATTSGSAITVAPEDLGEKKLEPGKNVFTINLLEFDPDTNTNTVINTYTITVEKFARIDERDPAVVWSGSGLTLSGDSGNPGDYSGTLSASYVAGDYFEYTTSCKRIKMGTRRGPGAGVVDIYLDGVVKRENFDLWMSTKNYQQEIFDSGDLTPGIHTVKMVMKGKSTHNVATPYGQLDYIEYIPLTAGEQVKKPVINPASSVFKTTQNVTISCDTPGATIHYTLDGSTPTTGSAIYADNITLSETATVKAIAAKAGLVDSEAVSATYSKASKSFYDDFSDGTYNKWTTYAGTWSVANGELSVNSGGGYKAVAKNTVFSDVSYEADIKVNSGTYDAGVLFRVTGASEGVDNVVGYYAGINLTNNAVVLGKMNNSWKELTNAAKTVAPNTTYHIKVTAVGSTIKVYVDNMTNPVISFEDSSFTHGAVGVRAHNTAVSYSNIKAEEIMPTISAKSQSGASIINTKAGTLQMIAEIAPYNAEIAGMMTWSVTNGTGSASISPSGLLTAETDGTVTVKAIAVDGWGGTIESKEFTVSISGQNGEGFKAVTAITVSGQDDISFITSEDGSLQMTAMVLPENAEDPSVTWSVINGTGSATIDANGVLKPGSRGLVTVKAAANDGSGIVSNEYTVAIAYPKTTFNNPIKINKGGDPYVLKADDGYYYMIVTEGAGNNNRITLRRSKSMSAIAYGEQKVIFNMPATESDVWAGEINQFDGRWYVYYNSTHSGDAGRRMHVLECSDSDPMTGNWIYKNQIVDSKDMYAIDGDVFQCNGKYYMLWSGKIGGIQRIYIGSMSNPYTLDSDMVMISEPTAGWETHGQPVNEGPIAMLKNGKVYITFSASLYVTNYYCLGLLTADQTSNLLDPASWTKTGPVFLGSLEKNIVSTGHNGFFQSADGTEDWLIYHSVSNLNEVPNERDVRMQKITWNGDVPDFGAPVANSTVLRLPSGETPLDTYEAEDAILTGTTKFTTSDPNLYNGFTGKGYADYVNNTGDSITFNIVTSKTDTYNISFRYTNESVDTKNMKLTVNGNIVDDELAFPTTSNGNDFKGMHYFNYSLSSRDVALNVGANTITLESNGDSGIRLDSLVIPELATAQTIPVTSISASGQNGTSTIATKGGTLQMTANVQPENATDKTVTWSVTNGTGSATINESGLLTAVTDGTVTVKATANDGSNVVSNEYDVTISGQSTGETVIPVASIVVSSQNGASTITTKSGTLQMLANVLPENATDKTVTWSVANGTGSATINESGLLTAVTDGNVTVKATANDGSNVVSNEFTVTISGQNDGEQPTIPVTAIAVSSQNGASTITTKSGTLQMLANVLPENAIDKTVTWSVTNGTGSATISDSGLLTAVSDGTVAVKATAKDGSNVVSNEFTVAISGQNISGGGDSGNGNNSGSSGNGSNSGSSGGSNSGNTGNGNTNTGNTDNGTSGNNTGKDNGGSGTTTPATPNFNDMEKYPWAKDAVETLAAQGIIRGTSATTFDPGKKITRADFMVMLVKALKLDADFTDNFADVSSGKYYYEAVGIAKKLGITNGTGNNKFNPKEEISRQDMMVLVVNALKAAGIELEAGTVADMAGFKDAENVSGYAKDAIAALIKAGIIKGSDNAINPKNDLKRAEAAAVIYQIYVK